MYPKRVPTSSVTFPIARVVFAPQFWPSMSPARPPPPHALATVSVAVLAFAARLAFGLWAKLPPAWDGELYERGARAIASGLGYSCFMFGPGADPHVLTAYYPVGYPAFLGALYAVFGVHPWVIWGSGALLGALTVALTHRLALRVASPRAALAAALTLALMPGQVMFSTTPMTEPLWGLCLTLAVWSLARTEAPRTRDWVLCALCLGAATYVRPQAVLLAPALPFVLPGTLRQRVLRAAAVTALVLATVAPWSLRNRAVLHANAFVSTNGGSNLAIGAVPEADGMYFILNNASGCRALSDEVVRDHCWRDYAVGFIRRDPLRWIGRMPTKLHHTIDYETFPLKYASEVRPDFVAARDLPRAYRAMSAPWRALYLLCFVALMPFMSRRNRPSVTALSITASAVVLSTHAVFFGGDRYHLPIAPFVAILAASAFRALSPTLRGEHTLRPADVKIAVV